MDNKLKKLLSSNHQILLDIIQCISDKADGITVHEISSKLSMSPRTIQRYLNKLEKLIVSFSCEKNQAFDFKKSNGIKFEINNNTHLLLLKKYIYEKDNTIQLLVYLLFNATISKKKYCQQTYLSESSLDASIEKINLFLSEFDLIIDANRLKIIGKETQIRSIAYSIAWILFENEEWPTPFTIISEKKITEDIQLLVKNLNLTVHYVHKRELSYLIAITILRYRAGNTVKCEKEWVDYFPTQLASSLSDTITQIILGHHIVSNEEIRFFTINLLTRPYVYENNPLRNELLEFIQKETIVYDSTKMFIEYFSEEVFFIPMDGYDDIFIFLYRSHLFAHIYDHMDFDYNGHYLLDEIHQKLPSYRTERAYFITCLYKKTGYSLFLETNYLIQRYYMIETFFNPDLLLGRAIKVVVETDLPEIFDNVIKKRLFDYFKYDYKLVFLNEQYLQKSDITLSTILKSSREGLIVHFNYPIQERDLINISENFKLLLNTFKEGS